MVASGSKDYVRSVPSIWLQTASALQVLQERFPEATDLRIPKFVLVGMQSAGKTRMLSAFAKCKLGGAEKNSTGTRCPVVYSFKVKTNLPKPECRIGDSAESEQMKSTDEKLIHERITSHMQKVESECENGFSDRPLFVEMCGNLSLNATVVDLPGLKPDVSDSANKIIEAMIRKFVSQESAIPIVMSQIPVETDMDFLEARLKQIVSCFQRKEEAHRAIVFVSRLDSVQQSVNDAVLRAWIDRATLPHLGFDRNNIIFFSLAPELLGGEQLVLKDNASYEEQTDYFRRILFEKEAKYLPARKAAVSDQFNFGVWEAVQRIEKTLENALRDNFQAAHGAMARLWQNLDNETKAKSSSLYSDEERVADYISLVTGMLHGIANASHQKIVKQIETASERNRQMIAQGDFSVLSADAISRIQRNFDEERRSIDFLPSVTLNEFLGTINGNIKKFGQLGSLVEGDLQKRLGSSAAVRRVLSLFGFYLLTHDLRSFDADLIETLGGAVDHVPKQSFNLAKAIHEMVNQHGNKARDCYKAILRWCAWIYKSHVRVASDVLRQYVHLLDDYPYLRDYIDKMLIDEYASVYNRIVVQMVDEASKIHELRFETLKTDEILGTVRLLGCLNLTRSMSMNNDTDASPKISHQQQANHHKSQQQVGEKERIEAARRFSEAVERKPSDHVDHVFDFFAATSSQAEAYFFSKGIALTISDINGHDVTGSVDKVNAKAQMFTRYNFGLFHVDFVNLVCTRLVVDAQGDGLHRQVREKTLQLAKKLFNTERGKVKLLQLQRSGSAQLGAKKQTAEQIRTYLDAAEVLNKCCQEINILPLEVELARSRLQELDKIIQAMSRPINNETDYQLADVDDELAALSLPMSDENNNRLLIEELLLCKNELECLRKKCQSVESQQSQGGGYKFVRKESFDNLSGRTRYLEEVIKALTDQLEAKTAEVEKVRTESDYTVTTLRGQLNQLQSQVISNGKKPK